MRAAAPLRPLNPFLLRRVEHSGHSRRQLAVVGGFPRYLYFYLTLREEKVRATPLLVTRLQYVAAAVGFPQHEIFLDEAGR
jgi:hypothetical protein